MISQSLNGLWKMKRTDDSKWIDGNVPGSVYSDLINAGMMKDPFYRDNEDEAKKVSLYDYEYEREFDVDESLAMCDNILLHCDGIDTISEIKINGRVVSNTNNMHRTYDFDIAGFIKQGRNVIDIVLFSPLNYIKKKQNETHLLGSQDAVDGFPHIRKAHCMFGWDWGPKLPDLGIWRSISINGYSFGRLKDVYVSQKHENGRVSLDIRVQHETFKNCAFTIEVVLTGPDGEKQVECINADSCENHIKMDVKNPKLWWPNGFGEHPLYNIKVILKKNDDVIDEKDMNIGLRTLTIKRQKDEWGESFQFEVNSVSIFAMGADYILEDNILSRCSSERTEKLIKSCIDANFNCIRVWGGGIYPPDYFYDLCDRYGLIVWQDLMYACAVYKMTDEFAENIKAETYDNIKRIRHHACLGVICGNNEIETGLADWHIEDSTKYKTDYIKQFEILLPETVKKAAPDIFYWPSSPSSGGCFDVPNDENRGDVHYWAVWHGQKPFTDYRKYYFRFVSEFGFQSFPCLRTVKSFTLPEDRNIFSYVMEKHQKNGSANGKMLYYLSENLKYPKDFDSLLYATQILQAEAIKYGVEHWRRNRGRCMGSIYWQLNDCWPVASWSSIDYYGRWKALHYFAKKFYAPVLISACGSGTNVELYVTNETMKNFKGKIIWKLCNNKSEVLKKGIKDVEITSLNSMNCERLELDIDEKNIRKTYLEYALLEDDKCIGSGTVLFTKEKYFEFLNPEIEYNVEEFEDKFVITINSKAFAKYVELQIEDTDCIFSDNYFDISVGFEKQVEIEKKNMDVNLTLNEFKEKVKIRSLYDMY